MTGTWASGWATGDIVTAAEFKKSAGSVFDSTLGGSASTIDVTGISNSYAHLMVTIYARGDTAAASTGVFLQFNGDGAANYDFQRLFGSAASTSAVETFGAISLEVGICPANTASANLFNATDFYIPNYANTTNNKQVVSMNANKSATTTGSMVVNVFGGNWRSVAAINRITFFPGAGNFVAGTRITVYALGA